MGKRETESGNLPVLKFEISASTQNQLKYFRSAVLFCCFFFPSLLFFFSNLRAKSQWEASRSFAAQGMLDQIQMKEPSPSQLSKMSEQVPKKHQSLAGHFPTFNETKYRRGLQNIFKPSHFRVMGDQQRKPERSETTICCILYYSTLRIREVTLCILKHYSSRDLILLHFRTAGRILMECSSWQAVEYVQMHHIQLWQD